MVDQSGPDDNDELDDDLQGILERRSDAMFLLDDDCTIQYVGDGAVSRLGSDLADAVGESFPERLGITDEADTTQDDGDTICDSLVAGWTDRRRSVKTADGSSVLVEISTVKPGADTAIICLLEFVSDSSKREDKQDRYERFLNTVGDPLYVLNENGVMEAVNDAMVEYSGYTRRELLDRGIEEVFSGREHGAILTAVLDSEQNGSDQRSESFETTLVTKTGALKRSEITVTALPDEQSGAAAITGVARNIDDQKQRERDLELLKTVLSRVLRHNVRTELNTIVGHIELLDERLDGAYQEHTQTVLDAATRLLDHSEKARLIEQVIDSSELKELDLAVEIERALNAVETEQQDPSVEVDDPTSITVEAHPRLNVAIEELIDNAIRHAPDGQRPRITLWTDPQPQFVTLFIEDESGGLSEHELDVLRSGTEEDLKHASGVGLWLVRWLVEYSKAELIAHRTENGTLMGIRFPRSDARDEIEHVAVQNDSPFVRTPNRFINNSSFERSHGETVVGRLDELHQLKDTYETVQRTGGQIVFVEGQSGVGKTTLVDEFCNRLESEKAPPEIARGICSPDRTPPYHVIGQVLSELPVSTTLQELLAGVSRFTDDGVETVTKRRQTLFSDIATELRVVAGEQPLVLVFEDLHRANRATVDLLKFLFDEVGRWAIPIMFVCTYQTSPETSSSVQSSDSAAVRTQPSQYDTPPVNQFVGDIEPLARSERLELEPLGRTDIRNLLEEVFDQPAPRSLIQSVHDRTEGNPLFVSELVKHLSTMLLSQESPAPSQIDVDGIEVFASLERTILDRIYQLPTSARSTLELGAVIGEWFTLDVLLEASELSEREVLESVELLVTNHFLTRDEALLRFNHGVIRDQVREQIESEESAHGRVAAALETIYEDRLEEQYARLGNHYERAGDVGTALEYYNRAGDQARRAYAHDIALEQYQRALTLAADHQLLEDSTTVSLLVNLAEVQNRTGDFDSARATTREALDLVEPSTVEQCRLFGIRAESQSEQGAYESALTNAQRQKEVAKRIVAKDLQAEALGRLGEIAKERGEYEEAVTHYKAGLDTAEEASDRHREATNRHGLGMVSWRQGNDETAQNQFEQSLEIAREVGDRQLVAASLSNLGIVFQYRGEYETAREYHEQSLEIAREIGDRQREAGDHNNLGIVAEHQGAYETARTHYEKCLEMKRAIGDKAGVARGLNNLGELFRYQGAYQKARKQYTDSREIHCKLDNQQGETVALINLGEVERECDNLDSAREHYEAGLDLAQAIESPRLEAHTMLGLAKINRNQENAELAREQLTKARNLFEETGDRAGVAKTQLEAGRVALLCFDLGHAREEAGKARDTFSDLGDQHQIGRADRLLGRIENNAGNQSDASNRFWDALETFETLEAVNDELKTLNELLPMIQEHGTTAATETLLERTQTLVSDAPTAVASKHEEWVAEFENQRD